jgi:hypothetical protein
MRAKDRTAARWKLLRNSTQMRLFPRIAEKARGQEVPMKITNFRRLDPLELRKWPAHSQTAPAVRLPQRSGQSPALRSDSFPEAPVPGPARRWRKSFPVRTLQPQIASS